MSDITKHEEVLLISILHLKDNTYGVNIRSKINEMTGQQWNYGTLYRILGQLVKKGLLRRKEGEPIPEKGGRRKNYYTLSKKGVSVLQEAYRFQEAIWGSNTKVALDVRGDYDE
ncbi:MAG: PadR family transcriptional regulator [bacterium]|nr:PadR family transcriptional regulator [bacterium]